MPVWPVNGRKLRAIYDRKENGGKTLDAVRPGRERDNVRADVDLAHGIGVEW